LNNDVFICRLNAIYDEAVQADACRTFQARTAAAPLEMLHRRVLVGRKCRCSNQIKSNLFASTKYKRKTIEKHKVNTKENQRHTDYEC